MGVDDNETEPPINSELIIPISLSNVLRPHQISALHFIWRKLVDDGMKRVIHLSHRSTLAERVRLYQEVFGCIIGHSMGLGKTVTALSFLLLLQKEYEIDSESINNAKLRAIVITPRSCTFQWQCSITEWMLPTLFHNTILPVYTPLGSRMTDNIILEYYQKGGILLLGYEEYQKLLKKAKEKMKGPPLCKRVNSIFDSVRPVLPLSDQVHMLEILETPDVVILDESHRLKKSNSKLVMELIEHLRRVQMRLALTGTPLQNHLEEYNVMYSVITGNTMNTAPFRRLFITPIERGQCADSTLQQFLEMQKCVASLRKFFGTTVHHCGPEVLERELPLRREYVILVGLSPKQEEVYRAMLKNYNKDDNKRIILALHHEASHICCHPLLNRKRANELMHHSSQFMPITLTNDDNNNNNNNYYDDNLKNNNIKEDIHNYKNLNKVNDRNKEIRRRSISKRRNKSYSRSSSSTSQTSTSTNSSISSSISSSRSSSSNYTSSSSYTSNYTTTTNSSTSSSYNSKRGKIRRRRRNIKRSKSKRRRKIRSRSRSRKRRSRSRSRRRSRRRTKSRSSSSSSCSSNYYYDDDDDDDNNNNSEKSYSSNTSSEVASLPDLNDAQIDVVLQQLNIKDSPKLALTLSLIHHICEDIKEKVVIFSIYRSHLFLLAKLLSNNGITSDVLHGGVDVRDRQRIIERFTNNNNNNNNNNNTRHVLLCSTKASGVGINLVAANHCILFDVSWNPADDTQATYRLFRYGQKKPVTIYRIATDGTFEHVVFFYALTKSWLHKKIADVADPTRYERHMKDNYFIYPSCVPVDFEKNDDENREVRTPLPNNISIQHHWENYAKYNCPALALTAKDGTFAWIRSIAEHSFLLRDNTEEVIREMEKKFEMERQQVRRLPVVMENINRLDDVETSELESILERCEPSLRDYFSQCAEHLISTAHQNQEKEKIYNEEIDEREKTAIALNELCELFTSIMGIYEPVGGLKEIIAMLFHRGVDQVMKEILNKPSYAQLRALIASLTNVGESLINSLRYRPCSLFSRMDSIDVTLTLTEMGIIRPFVPHCIIIGTQIILNESKASKEIINKLNFLLKISNKCNDKKDIKNIEGVKSEYYELIECMELLWPNYNGLTLPNNNSLNLETKRHLIERVYRISRERINGFLSIKEATKFIGVQSVKGMKELYHCKRCNNSILDRMAPDFILKCSRCHYSAEFDVQTHIDTRHACILYQFSVLCNLLNSFSIARSFTTTFVPSSCSSVLQVLQLLRQSNIVNSSQDIISDIINIGINVLIETLPETILGLMRLQCGVLDISALKELLAIDSSNVWNTKIRSHLRSILIDWFKSISSFGKGEKEEVKIQATAMPEMIIIIALQYIIKKESHKSGVYARDILLSNLQSQEMIILRFICDGLVKLNYAERLLANPLTRASLDTFMLNYTTPSESSESNNSNNNESNLKKRRNFKRRRQSSNYSKGSNSSNSVSIASVARRVRVKKKRHNNNNSSSSSLNSPSASQFSNIKSNISSSSFSSCYSDDDNDNISVASTVKSSLNDNNTEENSNNNNNKIMATEDILRLRSVHYWAAYCEIYGMHSVESLTVMIEDEETGMYILPPPPNSFWVNTVRGASREGMLIATVVEVFLEKITTLAALVRVIK